MNLRKSLFAVALAAVAGSALAAPPATTPAAPAKTSVPGGTFGRQFDDEATIDKLTAELLLELAEQLLTYLVVLPGTMTDLKGRIATAPVPLRRGSGAA